MTGKLYLVPTPIGNLKDITLRALEVLEKVDLIAAEDTRQSLKLLNHYNIKKRLISYHKHNEIEKSNNLIYKLKEGNEIALITDAGTPGISDPGSVLVKACIENDIKFEVLPGATAITTALVYSGLDTGRFIFAGFIPRENKLRNKFLMDLKLRQETLIFYEAPHRLISTLMILHENLGDRQIALCRELTKLHEEIIRLSLKDAVDYYDKISPRGEYVLVVEGINQEKLEKEAMKKWMDITIEEHLKMYVNRGLTKKEAIKQVSKDRNLSKSDVYKHSFDL